MEVVNLMILQNTFTPPQVPKFQITNMATSTITESLATTSLDNSSPDYSKYDYKNLEAYVHPPETKEKLNWAELVTLDLEDISRPGGEERLATQLHHAVQHVGFFCTPTNPFFEVAAPPLSHPASNSC